MEQMSNVLCLFCQDSHVEEIHTQEIEEGKNKP